MYNNNGNRNTNQNNGGYPNQQGGQRTNFVKKPPKQEGWYVLHIKEAWMTFYGQFNKLQVKFYVVNSPDGDPQKMHKQMTLTFNANVITGSIEDKLFKCAGGVNLMPNQQPDPSILINKYIVVHVGIQQAKNSATLYNLALDIAPLPPNFQIPQGYNPNYVYQRQGQQNGGQQYRQQPPAQNNPYTQQNNNQQGQNPYIQQNNHPPKNNAYANKGTGQPYNHGTGETVNNTQVYGNNGAQGNPYANAGNPPAQNIYTQANNNPPKNNNPYVNDYGNDAIDEEVPF